MAQRIVYFSWPATEIAGGIKLAFQHVQTLRSTGLDATVATPGGQPPTWFETDVPVVDVAELAGDEDVLVLPENHYEMLSGVAGRPNRKLVFCQNPFMAHRGLRRHLDYAEFGVSGILCEGRLTVDFCRRRFPAQPLAHVPVMVDAELFHFQPHKRMQIAFVPRKRPLEVGVIRDLLRAENPDLRKIPWVEIDDMPEHRVAKTLRDSAIYLSLCRFESVGLSCLEAMACGCATAGFTGIGAREYTTSKNGFWAADDDCFDCATQLAQAVRVVMNGGTMHSDLLEAAHLSASYYSRERFAEKVVGFWQRYLAGEEPWEVKAEEGEMGRRGGGERSDGGRSR